jgi:hypothetical protein
LRLGCVSACAGREAPSPASAKGTACLCVVGAVAHLASRAGPHAELHDVQPSDRVPGPATELDLGAQRNRYARELAPCFQRLFGYTPSPWASRRTPRKRAS